MSIIIFLWKLIIRIPRRFHGAKLFSFLLKIFLFDRIKVAKKNIKLCFKEMNKQELKGLLKKNLESASRQSLIWELHGFGAMQELKKNFPAR